ncbi:alcohol dehydrogenase catalytic domain-containing protein [bacterium]|nr:alcohol dehydrogenase catalytic domain-containing protein [bacterium]
MKAVVFDDELKVVTDYPMPTVKKGEALIRVLLGGICNTDYEITKGYMGYRGVLGHEFVGVVEQCEEESWIGKRVIGEINNGCEECDMCHHGLQRHCANRETLGIWKKDGCFAEYMTWSTKDLLIVPDCVTDEQAVFVEPLAAGLEILEQVHIEPSQRVVVLGDGKLGVTTALALNASNVDVTLVGKHENKLKVAENQGVKTVLLNEFEITKTWDFVVEATGSVDGFDMALNLTKPRGTLVLKSTVAASKEFNLAPIVVDEIRVQGSRCGRFAPALRLLENGRIDFSEMISGVYGVDDAVAAFDANREKGALKVLIRF